MQFLTLEDHPFFNIVGGGGGALSLFRALANDVMDTDTTYAKYNGVILQY